MTSERFELWKYFDSYKTVKRREVAILRIRGTELVHDYTTIPLPPLFCLFALNATTWTRHPRCDASTVPHRRPPFNHLPDRFFTGDGGNSRCD